MIDFIHSIEGLGAVAVFVVILAWPLQLALEDRARDAIFERRERLFDLAACGKLDFASPEYRAIRSSFEACIGYAHKITLGRLVLQRLYKFRPNVNNTTALSAERIADEDVRGQVKRLVHEVRREVFVLLVARSPLLWILAIAVLTSVTATKGIIQAKSTCVAMTERFGALIQAEAAASFG